MRTRSESGFTLVELVVAVSLLAVMMVLLYSGLAFASRSWDAGEANGRRDADQRLAVNFLRREVTELFPMRWKDPMMLKFAFDGQPQLLRFVSSRPPEASLGGLSLVELRVENGPGRERDLVMRRAMPDDDAKDFGPLEKATPTVMVRDVDSVAFSYFGSDSDYGELRWLDTWTYPGRVPKLIRLTIRSADGSLLPALTFRTVVSEEAGCLENSFQRVCRPRRVGP